MWAIPLICSVLTLQSVSSADEPTSFKTLANELQHEILVSNSVDFCEYVRSIAEGVITPASLEVENTMLTKVAEEEWGLDLDDDKQRVRKQQILKSVRALVRLHSPLPIICKTTDTDELEHLAGLFESTFQYFSSFSESPTWKKACMSGLFRRNTLMTLLPYLSKDFCDHNKVLLLQTAFFVGDIDSLGAIVTHVGMSNDEVLEYVPESDIVFSNDGTFFKKLFKRLPKVMEKRLNLIRTACSLQHLDILLCILKAAKPIEREELDEMIDLFSRFKMYNNLPDSQDTPAKLCRVLSLAAEHGHLPMIRFLWPVWKTIPNGAKMVIREMMIGAGRNNHRGVLEFLLRESGGDYMKMAQEYVNVAFEAAVGEGNVEIMNFFIGDDNAGNPVAPGLGLTQLSQDTLNRAIVVNRNWKGISYLVDLKKKGDFRFAHFELVDRDNTALCLACKAGDDGFVEYLLPKAPNGQFVALLTNPAAKNNTPLVNACWSGKLQIVEKLLERDVSGKYIYQGIDPSAQDYESIFRACRNGHSRIVEFLLKMKDEKYVLPEMEGVDLTEALSTAITWNQMEVVEFFLKMEDGSHVVPRMNGVDFAQVLSATIKSDRIDSLEWLLRMNEGGKHVLPGMNSVEFAQVLATGIEWELMESLKWLLRMNKEGKYVLPGMNNVDFTRVLLAAIKGNQSDILKWLLSINKGGEHVLPGMNGVDFASVLSAAIEENQRGLVEWLLRMNERGEYVLPRMNGVDLTEALKCAIKWDRVVIVGFLLRRALDGSWLLPGVKVTQDMLMIVGQRPEMIALLEMHLGQ